MILDFFSFPIKVVIFKKYGNVLKPAFDRARYERKIVKTQDGIIENSYLILKNEKVKIPAPHISFYYDIDNTRYIYLLQLDRHTFYPISFEGNKITVRIRKNVKDEKGNTITTWEEIPLFDSNIVLDDGNLIQLPSMIAYKTYNKEHWLSSEIENAFRLYRSRGFWEKYGNFVVLAVVGIILVMFFYVGVSKYADLTKTLVDGLKEVSQSMNVIADKLSQTAKAISGQPIENVTKPPF